MKKGFSGVSAILLIAAIALAAVAFGFGFWISSQEDTSDVVFDDMVEDEVGEIEDVEEVEDIEEVEPTVLENEGAINVDWYAEISEIEPLAIFTEHLNLLESTEEPNSAFALGEVVGGDYGGAELTMQIVYYWGMGTYYEEYYVLVPADELEKPILIDQYLTRSTGIFSFTSTSTSFLEEKTGYTRNWDDEQLQHYYDFVSGIDFEMELYIPELEYAETGTDIDGVVYEFMGPGTLTFFTSEKDLSPFEISSYMSGDNLYAVSGDEGELGNMTNLFFRVGDDGRVLVYDVQIPFWDYEVSGYQIDLEVVGDVNFSGTYTKALGGGCGYSSVTNVADENEIGELQYVGSVDGHALYEPQNHSLEYYSDDYSTWLNMHEDSDLDTFLAIHPFLYYQDTLGRWIEFTNNEVVPAAECGKPVIYLYPEVETQIDVTLDPVGGFTYTEPIYDDGWSVVASTDGSLLNLKDGETYPYLFWEGRGGIYTEPEFYWVVEKDQVERFLIKTLGKLGLNRQETFDFMEFWYPRMQEADFYKIGFHGTEVMDIIAPMELSVEPDSILRILMDFTELDQPIEPNPPKIEKFNRKGFAVVEWGGVIQ